MGKLKYPETCKRGHSRWGFIPSRDTRYCLDCESYRAMRRRLRKSGVLGKKSVAVMEAKLDFEIEILEKKIAELVANVVELKNEKMAIRYTYEKRIEERKATK